VSRVEISFGADEGEAEFHLFGVGGDRRGYLVPGPVVAAGDGVAVPLGVPADALNRLWAGTGSRVQIPVLAGVFGFADDVQAQLGVAGHVLGADLVPCAREVEALQARLRHLAERCH